MSTFTDAKGREWTIEILLGVQKKVKQDVGVDLFDAEDHLRIAVDPECFGQVIYSILEKQVTARDLDIEEFWNGFDGATLEAATRSLHEALVYFFQKWSPAKGEMFQAILSKTEEMLAKGSSLVAEKIDSAQLDRVLQTGMDAMDKQVEDILERMSSDSSTN